MKRLTTVAPAAAWTMAGAALLLAACGQSGSAASDAPTSAPAATVSTDAQPAIVRPAPVTPDEVRALIARDGPQGAVAALMQPVGADGGARWGTVENGVASGEQVWLDLYPAIRPGTDGETGEGLSMALSQALTANAAGALRLMNTEIDDVAGHCQSRQIEPTAQERTEFYTRAIAAVEAVDDPALAQRRTACLAALRAAQAQPA